MEKKNRLKNKIEIDNLFNNKKSVRNFHYSIFYQKNDLPHFRFAISVGKKFGGAVARNLVKRRLREIIRFKKDEIKNYDFVIVVRSESKNLEFQEMKEKINKLLSKSQII